jgi:hypothetical protein
VTTRAGRSMPPLLLTKIDALLREHQLLAHGRRRVLRAARVHIARRLLVQPEQQPGLEPEEDHGLQGAARVVVDGACHRTGGERASRRDQRGAARNRHSRANAAVASEERSALPR